jgi:hypothetical protein
MSTTHGIPAASWQLQAATEQKLRAIVLPLLPEPNLAGLIPGEQYWRWKPKDGIVATWWDKWYSDLYKLLRYQPGDRIFLQEKWCKHDDDLFRWVEPTCEVSEHEAEWLNWQPAETMPHEAAQYWFKISEVKVTQVIDLTAKDLRLSGLYILGNENGKNVDEVISLRWNLAYPNQPWHSDRWVIVLAVEAIAKP